jgi:DNA-binding transcriptional MerR regulator
MEERDSRLPAIPAKRYFTIGEVSELCGVKPYVLRYWEQEFTQLRPVKRRGNRRYYQHHEVLLIRRIRDLLYDQGFTISGARNRLTDAEVTVVEGVMADAGNDSNTPLASAAAQANPASAALRVPVMPGNPTPSQVREELQAIRDLLGA